MATDKVRIPADQLRDDFEVNDDHPVVIVRVGAELDGYGKPFIVEEALIARSAVMEDSLELPQEESKTPVIQLPNDDPAIFSTYLHMVHTGSIPCISASDERGSWALADLYLFAQKIQDVKSMNRVVDGFVEIHNDTDRIQSRATIEKIYNGTDGPCAIRRLLVDTYAEDAEVELIQRLKNKLPREFMNDLTIKLMKSRHSNRASYKTFNASDYYQRVHDIAGKTLDRRIRPSEEQLGEDWTLIERVEAEAGEEVTPGA